MKKFFRSLGIILLLAVIFAVGIFIYNNLFGPCGKYPQSTPGPDQCWDWKSKVVLPPSFTMVVKGDFTDSTLIPAEYKGSASNAFLMSSDGGELQGEVQYTYASPGTNGNLVLCEIKDGKWISSNTPIPKKCNALTKLATTRTELERQITSGELKSAQTDLCTQQNRLCYEFK